MSVIEVINVNKTFGKGESATHVLNDCTLKIEAGEFVSLMGASGSGKSTLLYLIGGLDREFDGTIKILDTDIGKLKESKLSKLRLEKVGFIFQFYNLVQNLNVTDNILLPSNIKGKTTASMKADLDRILEITGLTSKAKSMPAKLSGGEQQRVAIARALIGNPDLILADEPTGNLDSKMTAEIMELFAKINKEEGKTILMVTHSPECAEYGTRTIVLEDGHVKE
ncbi:MAG: ABC transporter ATP-binding protein [Saccharofermentans sp.]|nr:ABC transporter ATP-binding protein [Saccharofermentans sp.]